MAEKKASELGTTICQYARNQPSPSTRAASSSSLGKLRKYCRNRNVVSPLNRVGTMIPCNVSTQRSWETMMKLGMNVTAAGIISVTRVA